MIYLDNAATSFPKPPVVAQAMERFVSEIGMNINRGVYPQAADTADIVYETRERLARLFNVDEPDNVVFTGNVTQALNTVLLGFLEPGDHVIVSSMEHNAVMRPLHVLVEKGVAFTRVQCDLEGRLDPADVERAIEKNTKAIIMTHASNVSGTLMPLHLVGEVAHKHGLRFIVDSAQTAGVVPVNSKVLQADAICFTGHKSLMGPQGVGGIAFSNGFEQEISPLVTGGTGSSSDLEVQPEYMPDRFESGTPNLPGIFGLHASLGYLEEVGIPTIRQHELGLVRYLLNELDCSLLKDWIQVAGPKDAESRTGVVSLVLQEDMARAAHRAAKEADIAVRVGMHCAPSAHKTLGTFPQGTFRVGIGYFNSYTDIDILVNWLRESAQRSR